MTVAIFWVLFAVAVGIFASNKGRSGFGWFLLSLIISPLLGLIFCAVSKDLNASQAPVAPSAATHRKCPACAEFVLPEATVCKHCGKALVADTAFWLKQVAAQKEVEARETSNMAIGIVFVVGLIVVASVISKCTA